MRIQIYKALLKPMIIYSSTAWNIMKSDEVISAKQGTGRGSKITGPKKFLCHWHHLQRSEFKLW
jgi:hypothetical protein